MKRWWMKRLGYLRDRRWGGLLFGLLLGLAAIVALLPSLSLRSAPLIAQEAIAQGTAPSPTAPIPSPATTPLDPARIPAVPIDPTAPLPRDPAPPVSTAPPAPLEGTYTDPAGRFKVGILKDYKSTPLAGAVLIESPNGNVAYTVVPQSQPLGAPIGLAAGYDNSESLAKVATTVFQRGEGFQPGQPRMESGGGAVMNWTGSLTIAGTTQPMQGVILVRPSSRHVLLLLVAATKVGEAQIPSAIAALAPSLEPIQ